MMMQIEGMAAMAEAGRVWKIGDVVGVVEKREADRAAGADGWFIVYTGGSSEARCLVQLERRGWHGYVPMTFRWRMPVRKRGRLRADPGARRKLVPIRTDEPMFPGYIFVAADRVRDPFDLLFIPNVANVVRREDDHFHRVPALVVEGVREREGRDRTTSAKAPKSMTFKVGQLVRVSEGPFAGFNGVVSADDDGREVVLDLSIFGQAAPATMPVDWIEAL